ncbi:MAG: hypothetical protein HOC23_24070 [Halieaceae bacterium]|mgnify:CR=1 FL=1|jgi:type IV pilus assembly protein PilW|nr:hypothetical protein [Halieaceae bacterium]
MPTNPSAKYPRRISVTGFGLIELMVAVSLMGVLLTGLLELYLSSRQNYSATDSLSRLQENGRTAIEMIAADIRRAGFIGSNSDASRVAGSLGPAAAATTCPTNDTTWARMITQSLYGIDDANTNYACISDSQHLRGDILTLRYASPWLVADGNMAANTIYMRSTLYDGRLFAGTDQGSAANDLPDIIEESREMMAHAYHVGATGRTCNGDAIPALFRVSVGSAGLPVRNELLAGVEHFQVQYNTGVRYVDAGSVSDWSTVRSIKIWVLARAECPETGFTSSRTFPMANLSPVYGPTDRYRRQLFTTVVAMRNSAVLL